MNVRMSILCLLWNQCQETSFSNSRGQRLIPKELHFLRFLLIADATAQEKLEKFREIVRLIKILLDRKVKKFLFISLEFQLF